jgi:fimbrial chaperone protein
MRRLIRSLALALTSLILMSSAAAVASTSLLIWPLDPTIEAGQKAGVVWLENVGTAPVTLQIRVFGWDQSDFADRHNEQGVIVATPPFTTIAPGKKQLVRLTLTSPPAPGEERAYRIIVDEIPVATPTTSTGLRFQMRYSLPLFAYGEGLWRKQRGQSINAVRAEPVLSWRLVEESGKRYVQIRNTGRGHARLSQVRFTSSAARATDADGDIDVATGLLGYVLPGSVMRWPAPDDVSSGHQLQVQLEANAPPQTLPRD